MVAEHKESSCPPAPVGETSVSWAAGVGIRTFAPAPVGTSTTVATCSGPRTPQQVNRLKRTDQPLRAR